MSAESPMPAEDNKAIVQRFWDEIFDQGDFGAANEIVDPEWVLHQSHWTGGDRNLEGFRGMLDKFRAVYPNLDAQIESATVEGERVMTRFNVTGTRVETEIQVEVEGISISLIYGGRIKESWVNWDAFGLVQQESPEEPRWPRCWWC